MNTMRQVQIALESSDIYTDLSDIGLACVGWNFPEPTPKLNFMNVNGTDGSLDLSDVFRGEIPLNDVTATIRLFVRRPALFDYEEFKQAYHGERVKLKNSEDPGRYRVGRIWITKTDTNCRMYQITLNGEFDPYKYAEQESMAVFPYSTDAPTSAEVRSTSQYGTPVFTPATSSYGAIFRVYSDTLSDRRATANWAVEIPPRTDLAFYYTITKRGGSEVSIQLKLEDGTPITPGDRIYSGDNTAMIVRLSTYGDRDAPLEISDFRWSDGSASSLYNAGRKLLVPRVVSSTDATIFSALGSRRLSAGIETDVFEVPLTRGKQSFSVISDVDGYLTVRFREGYL